LNKSFKNKGTSDNLRSKNEIDVPSELLPEKGDPWITNLGIFKDDLTFDDFLAEMRAYRNEIDSVEVYH
jgi:hypothetical protein